MGNRTSEDEQSYYVCGQCKDRIYYIKSEEPPVPCPDCGWYHKAKKKRQLPAKFKINLADYE